MTIQPWYAVWCDQEGCIEWTDGGATRAEAARAARRESWHHVGKWWYCPGHTADPAPDPISGNLLDEDPEDAEPAIEANSRRLDAKRR